VTGTIFDEGVLLPRARLPTGTSTLASGKYAAAAPRGTSYATARKRGASRSTPSAPRERRSTQSPASSPRSARSSACISTTRRAWRMPR
jgi:hypothetical protein